MDLHSIRREMTGARKRAEEAFASRLAASGAARGLDAKQSGTEGELRIYEVIGEDFWTGAGVTAPDVAAKLDGLKGVNRLHVYINSPGGDLFTGKTIFNQIARFPAAEKIVHVEGIAASAASLIAMAGTKIITEEGGTWLVHEVAMWAVAGGRGTAADHRKTADEIEVETKAILGIYEKRTKRPAESLAALMREDRIISAAEAKSFGLTDEISEVEQGRVDKAAESARTVAALPHDVVYALAQAKARELRAKFSPVPVAGAAVPCQPGKTSKEPSRR